MVILTSGGCSLSVQGKHEGKACGLRELLPAAKKMQLGLFLFWAPSSIILPLGQSFILCPKQVLSTLSLCVRLQSMEFSSLRVKFRLHTHR